MGQKIFFDGQIYDAFSLLISLVEKAEKSIVLIDNYVDVGTLKSQRKSVKHLFGKKNLKRQQRITGKW